MKKSNLLIFALVVIISVLALTIFLQNRPLPEESVSQPEALVQKPEKKAIVHYPVPVLPQEPPPKEDEAKQEKVVTAAPVLPKKLPPVQQSDKSIQQALGNLKLKRSLANLILSENFIQRLVVTIDSLPEKRLPRAHSPLVPPKGRFIISGTSEAPQTSSRNHPRYATHLKLMEALDPDLVLKIYVHFYPLFQSAYEQLGYRNAYFNDRLVAVLDHLLETPNPPEPILLAQPAVLYTYADPMLENLSSGQKVLLRIGPDQRSKVMDILKIYREKLTTLQP